MTRTCASARLLAATAAVAVLMVTVPVRGQQPGGRVDPTAIRGAVEGALAVAPRGFDALQPPAQAGVQLRGVAVETISPAAHRITIDLGQKTLTYDPSGAVEPILDHLIARTATLTQSAEYIDYRLLVDGVPLDQLLTRPAAGRARAPRRVGAAGRVVISAGHGWYRHEPSNEWRLQREYFWGIVEDFVNHDIADLLESELRGAGLDVRRARNPDRHAGAGVSGHPRWQEGAKYYIRDLGAPASVWDYGGNDYDKDINSRPFYANWIDSEVLVSIHNNGGGGTGTETWFDTINPHQAESRRLAEIVNRRVVSAIRTHYDPAWPDRGLRSCNGCKGENRLADRPSVIVEIAFMDRKSPDNDALHDDRFKRIVARAIRDALHEWGIRAPAPLEDYDAQARREIADRAARDPRFVGVIDGSFGVDPQWDPGWELRWLDVRFTGGRQVRIWHAAARNDRSIRYIGFWDPDTGAWVGWDRV